MAGFLEGCNVVIGVTKNIQKQFINKKQNKSIYYSYIKVFLNAIALE